MRSPLITAWRVLQYPVGLIVAAVISFGSAFILLSFQISLLALHAFVGFVGVFAGSVLFLPDSRRIGALFLALVGVAFFYVRFVLHDVGPASVPDGWLRLAFISVGATVAVVSHFAWHSLSRRRTHEHPTAS